MPNGNGTGSFRSGSGRGRNNGGAFGTGGSCVCAFCGTKVPHTRGVSCTKITCPKCGKPMIREELLAQKRGTSV